MTEAAETRQMSAVFGWRQLGTAVAAGMLLWTVGATIAFGGIDPFIVAYAVIYTVVLALLRTQSRSGPIALVVVSGLTFLLGASFSAGDLAHPESWRGFVVLLAGLLLTATGVMAGLGVLRGWDPSLARRVGVSATAILVTGVVLSLGAAASLESDVAQPGDQRVMARDVSFVPSVISAPSGTVNVLVENDDLFRHTFTIRALGVDVELPAGTDRRVSFEAPPGAYDIVCEIPGHESMTMTLRIEG